MPTLVVVVPEPLPEGAVVALDGEPVADDALAELRLPPGEYRLSLTAPGRERTEASGTLAEGDRERVELILGAELSLGPLPEEPEPNGPSPQPAVLSSDGLSGVQFGGIVVGAVGLAGVVVGAVTGGLVLSKKTLVDEQCQDDVCVDQEGVDAAASGRTLATVSTVAFVAGGAAITAGILMVVLGGSDDEAVAFTPMVGVTTAGLSVRGRW